MHLQTKSGISLRHLEGNTFDVFIGDGWNNWSRIRTGKAFTHVIAGNRLSNEQIKEIHNKIHGK